MKRPFQASEHVGAGKKLKETVDSHTCVWRRGNGSEQGAARPGHAGLASTRPPPRQQLFPPCASALPQPQLIAHWTQQRPQGDTCSFSCGYKEVRATAGASVEDGVICLPAGRPSDHLTMQQPPEGTVWPGLVWCVGHSLLASEGVREGA